MSFEEYRRILEGMELRSGSITDRCRHLILSGEILSKPMSSSDVATVYYRVVGKRIHVSNISKYLQLFQEKGIIRREMEDGKIIWYGSWQATHENSAESLYDQLIHNRRIRKVSRDLFNDGHYASAILEAYKTLNNMVKEKSGLQGDGQDLMARAFNERDPSLLLNGLSTQSEKDEQMGFRFIFMGAMAGIRNPKAHDNVVQRSPMRTLQYLALADLLATRIDEAKERN
jgi:uncharacterized protein (TIGR02391 family)